MNTSPGGWEGDDIVLAVHGGAGPLRRENKIPGWENACAADLKAALRAGYAVWERGGSSLDAVEASVRWLEDSPWFNAGRGAAFTFKGGHELDASIMDGRTGLAGAVAGVTTVRNPITAARAVMERSPHVLLIGPGADRFAADAGLEIVAPGYFDTPARRAQWERQRQDAEPTTFPSPDIVRQLAREKHGTVGAVARDRAGNLAAATSTGGMSNKRYGRVGDSPVPGAGIWADNATCAVSSTGHGEFFLRLAIAHDIAARMAYDNQSVTEAASRVIHETLTAAGGTGGVIALDARGRCVLPFNTEGMFRGAVTRSGETRVRIFAD